MHSRIRNYCVTALYATQFVPSSDSQPALITPPRHFSGCWNGLLIRSPRTSTKNSPSSSLRLHSICAGVDENEGEAMAPVSQLKRRRQASEVHPQSDVKSAVRPAAEGDAGSFTYQGKIRSEGSEHFPIVIDEGEEVEARGNEQGGRDRWRGRNCQEEVRRIGISGCILESVDSAAYLDKKLDEEDLRAESEKSIPVDYIGEEERKCSASEETDTEAEAQDSSGGGEDGLGEEEDLVILDPENSRILTKKNDISASKDGKKSVKVAKKCQKTYYSVSCIARRTRSSLGDQPRVSYSKYFKKQESDNDEENEESEEFEPYNDDTDETSPRNTKCAREFGSDGCKEQRRCFMPSWKKKILSGLFVDETNPDCSGSRGCNHIAKQSSPHFEKLGATSNPFHLDARNKNDVEHATNKGDSERVTQQDRHDVKTEKRKRGRPPKIDSVFKLLLDAIISNTQKIPGDASAPKNEPCDVEPDFFSFGDEDTKTPEKSDYDRAMDELWADFEFAMGSTNIGAYNVDECQNVENDRCEYSLDGNHCFVHDEQTGTTCKFCDFVSVEIKHHLPSWDENMRVNSRGRSFDTELDKLSFANFCDEFKNLHGQASDSLASGTVWDLIPGLYKTMYKHQQQAFEFMWRNIGGSIYQDELKSDSKSDVVGGCVISHAPGTGKTRLTIVFIQTYMRVFPKCRPVIIAPRGMLLTWEEEAKKWDVNIPIHNLNSLEYSGKEDISALSLAARERRSSKLVRLVKLCSWEKGNSILGVSYTLFKKLINVDSNGISNILLEKPDLLILDEGHIPRNERSLIWKVLEKVKTEKRIILSGTPFQNNFGELYNILWLVRPKFAEEISNSTLNPIRRQEDLLDKEQDILPKKAGGKETWDSLTNNVNDKNVEEVRKVLKPFVHIHNGSILKNLPGMKECIIVLNPHPIQQSIIDKVKQNGSNCCFDKEYRVCLASIHPSLVLNLNMSEEEELLLDKSLLENLKLNPVEGAKTRFVIEVVRLCESLNEKVLVFSQYIFPLNLIRDQLIKEFNYIDGREVIEMTGKFLMGNRQSSIDRFNDAKSEAKVLLASTKACCEGISLTGASRVILLDVVWNPAVGRQAISRAYRIGQEKFVYAYNLITMGTGEKEKYAKQVKKDHLSKLVFSPEIDFSNVRNSSSQSGAGAGLLETVSGDKILEQIVESLKDIFVDIDYPSKEYSICS